MSAKQPPEQINGHERPKWPIYKCPRCGLEQYLIGFTAVQALPPEVPQREHEWMPPRRCSCGWEGVEPIRGNAISCETQWHAHIYCMLIAVPQREEATKPPVYSFPDYDGSVEPMPREKVPKPPQSYTDCEHPTYTEHGTVGRISRRCNHCGAELIEGKWTAPHLDILNATAAPAGTSQGLEAECYKVIDAWDETGVLDDEGLDSLAAKLAAFIRTRDRELVEKLEGALNADGDWESREAALRAVLAARKGGAR